MGLLRILLGDPATPAERYLVRIVGPGRNDTVFTSSVAEADAIVENIPTDTGLTVTIEKVEATRVGKKYAREIVFREVP